MPVREHFSERLNELQQSIIKEWLLVVQELERSVDALKQKDIDVASAIIENDEDVNRIDGEINDTCMKKSFVPNSSFRPYYKEGSKTSGTEIALQLKNLDEEVNIVYPLGSGALFCSAYKGIEEFRKLGVPDF